METTQGNVELQEFRTPPVLADRPRVAVWAQAAVIGVLLFCIFRPMLRNVVLRWNGDPNWSHGWLVPLFSVYFLYTRRDQIARTPAKTCYVGLFVLLAALGAYFFFFGILPLGYFQVLSLVGVIFGVTLFLSGWAMMRIAWLPILFLCFANPIPDQYYVQLTMPLRRITTQLAALLLRLIPGIELEVQGVIIDYNHHGVLGNLNVEEACAGMRLMMAFVTLGVAMAYLGNRPTWQRICMVLSCVPIAVFCNIIRVTTTGAMTIHGDHEVFGQRLEDLAQGTAHGVLGLVMLPIALGLFALTGHILKHVLIEEPPTEVKAGWEAGESA